MIRLLVVNENAVVAIGDVHGCYCKLMTVLSAFFDTGCELIFLGDLIDRSPEENGDIKVLNQVFQMQRSPGRFGVSRVTVLRGNHEQMFLDAKRTGDLKASLRWVLNGGDPRLLSDLSQDLVAWLDDLPFYAVREDHLFVHAGVRPGIPLEKQRHVDLMWIRQPFLSQDHGLAYKVIHGHTIEDWEHFSIVEKPWRIGIDTGAFAGGPLSTYIMQRNSF